MSEKKDNTVEPVDLTQARKWDQASIRDLLLADGIIQHLSAMPFRAEARVGGGIAHVVDLPSDFPWVAAVELGLLRPFGDGYALAGAALEAFDDSPETASDKEDNIGSERPRKVYVVRTWPEGEDGAHDIEFDKEETARKRWLVAIGERGRNAPSFLWRWADGSALRDVDYEVDIDAADSYVGQREAIPGDPGHPGLAVDEIAGSLAATGSLRAHLLTAITLLRGGDPREPWARDKMTRADLCEAVILNFRRFAGSEGGPLAGIEVPLGEELAAVPEETVK